MRVRYITLGCKCNQFEAGALEKLFQASGHPTAKKGEQADCFLISTCAVTAESERKCRQQIRKVRRENPDALIAVTGCYSQIDPELMKALNVNIVSGVTERSKVVSLCEEWMKDHSDRQIVRPVMKERVFQILEGGSFGERTRALLKIQDGCDNFCTYCIIPYARGRSRSMPVGDVLRQAKDLKEKGFKEIVITGIEISHYGRDLEEETDFCSIVGRICALVSPVRVHLGSIDPRSVDERFIAMIREHENLCRHFHLSLQSGCDRTLGRMGRRYTASDYEKACRYLYEAAPGCAVTADLITGFAGETEEDFRESLALIRRCSLAAVHVFPYSERPGTKAAQMPDQVPKHIREERAKMAIEEAAGLRKAYLESHVGKTLDVLFETSRNGCACGHTDTYCDVITEDVKEMKNTLRKVYIERSDEAYLYGRVLQE